MKFTISILGLNNLALSKRCIESVLAAGSKKNEAELILTNNGSTDGSREYFEHLAKTHKNVRMVHNATNQGFIEPNKVALEMARGKYLVLLNNDCVVSAGWLDRLEEPFVAHPTTAAISGREGGCSELLQNFHGCMGNKEYIEGSCLMIPVAIAKKHGLFSPELVGAYGEDSDLSLRMRELGYTLHWVQFPMQHVRGATSATVPQAREWQARNHLFLRSRWAQYLKARTMDYPIIIRRRAAWGDVLLTTGVIRAIKRVRPLSPIWVETACPDVFRDNPHVAKVAAEVFNTPQSLNIPLDMCYESQVEQSIVGAYWAAAEEAIHSPLSGGSTPEMFLRDEDREWRKLRITTPLASEKKPILVVHPGPVSWKSKEWGVPKFNALLNVMRKDGWAIVLVGAVRAEPLPCTLDLRGATTVHQMAALMECASLFVGVDSFPLHVAQAMGTPVLGIFGITSAKYILTAKNAVGIDSTAPSAGLRHRTLNATEVRDGGEAMAAISVEQVVSKVRELTDAKVPAA